MFSKERHISHSDVLHANVAVSVGAVKHVQWLQLHSEFKNTGGSRFIEDNTLSHRGFVCLMYLYVTLQQF